MRGSPGAQQPMRGAWRKREGGRRGPSWADTIAMRIGVPLGIIVIVVATGNLLTVRATDAVEEANKALSVDERLLDKTHSAAHGLESAANDERGFLLLNDQTYRQQFRQERDVARELLAEVRSESTGEVREQVTSYLVGIEKWSRLVEEEFLLTGTGLTFHREAVTPARTAYEAEGKLLIEALDEEISLSREQLEAALAQTRVLSLSVLVLTFMVALAAATWLILSTRGPLRHLARNARRIAGGELDVDPLILTRTDEVGELASSFNEMSSMLATVGDQARSIADGHLTAEVLRQRTPGDLGDAFDTMIGSLTGMVNQLTASSSQLSASAQQLEQMSTTMGTTAEQASAEASSASAAVEQIYATTQDVAANANEASRVTAETVTLAHATSDTIQLLGSSGAEIGSVIEVITDIADQTNMLALNATIEAARSGEAGKGFAVVANEVKELANQTAKATGEIAERIQAIQGATANAVEANRRIGDKIDEIDGIATAIAAAVEQQTITASEIARNITDVASAARNTSDSTRETEASAADLNQMAAELGRLVSRYS